MNPLLHEIRRNPLLWLLAFVPAVFAATKLAPTSHTLLFVLSVLAIVPLAALLSHATESVAAKTGDAVGGLLNATLGNLTELVIALDRAARRRVHAGQGVARRRHRHQHPVHARRVVPPRRAQTPRAGVQPGERPAAGGTALPGHDRAAHPLGGHRGRFRRPGEVHQHALARPRDPAHRHLRARHGVLPADASRVLRQRGARRGGRGALADGPGARRARGSHRAGGAGERGLRRIGAGGGEDLRDDSGLRRLHRRGAGRRCGGDGLRLLRGAQEPARPRRRHRAGERRADRALRRPGAGAAQLLHRPDADGPAVLAGRRRDDAHRHPHRRAGDQQRPVGLVRRRAGADGLPDLRHDALPPAARRPRPRDDLLQTTIPGAPA